MKLINSLILIIYLFLSIFLKSTLALSLSIIVPAYNSGPFLDRCIKSILNQTFKDYELILVDDASSDNSLDILKKYKESDIRIKIIHLEINKGPGGARNIGMDYAEGEFIGFVDSDDYIDESFFEILMKNSYDNDIIVGHMVKGTNISDNYIKEKPSIWAVCDKIWKKNFLKKNNIRFNELMRHGGEDIEFNNLAYKFNPKILKLSDERIYYYYKRRTGSNTNYSKKQLRKFERMAKKENLINKKNRKKLKKLK